MEKNSVILHHLVPVVSVYLNKFGKSKKAWFMLFWSLAVFSNLNPAVSDGFNSISLADFEEHKQKL